MSKQKIDLLYNISSLEKHFLNNYHSPAKTIYSQRKDDDMNYIFMDESDPSYRYLKSLYKVKAEILLEEKRLLSQDRDDYNEIIHYYRGMNSAFNEAIELFLHSLK